MTTEHNAAEVPAAPLATDAAVAGFDAQDAVQRLFDISNLIEGDFPGCARRLRFISTSLTALAAYQQHVATQEKT